MNYKRRKQLNAISYSYSKRKREKQEAYMNDHDLWNEFKESKYKTVTWFLASKGCPLMNLMIIAVVALTVIAVCLNTVSPLNTAVIILGSLITIYLNKEEA